MLSKINKFSCATQNCAEKFKRNYASFLPLNPSLHSESKQSIYERFFYLLRENIKIKNQNCEIAKVFAVMSNAWLDESSNQDNNQECDKKFEDNFVTEKKKEFQKLDDSEEYLSKLGELRLVIISSNHQI